MQQLKAERQYNTEQYKVPDFPSSFALKPDVARTAHKEGESRRRWPTTYGITQQCSSLLIPVC